MGSGRRDGDPFCLILTAIERHASGNATRSNETTRLGSQRLPSAWEAGAEMATDANGEPVEIDCTDEAPLAAYIFKTVADPFVGKLSYFKVVSGKLSGEPSPVRPCPRRPSA